MKDEEMRDCDYRAGDGPRLTVPDIIIALIIITALAYGVYAAGEWLFEAFAYLANPTR